MLKDVYCWLTLAITFFISLFFLGDIWKSPGNYLFSSGGDGLQTYYQSIYHVKYDSTFLHQQGMNYPYGESIFFTGGQPFLSNVVKTLQPVIDLSDHMVGLTNLMMLVGILICPVFLYLIFRQYKLERWQSMLFAIGLTFLTQQLERFGGHYPLAYLYAVPGMIYFLLRFYRAPGWKWSAIIALYILFLVFAHIYYLVFFAIIAFGFWVSFILFNKERALKFPISILHVIVQLIAPFAILRLFIGMSSDVADRTAVPWGFMLYRSGWSGYLFPYGMWYEKFFTALKPATAIEWEGLAFIGGSAIIMFVCVLIATLIGPRKFFAGNSRWENRSFIALAIAALLCIAVSFAFPFNYGLENLLNKLGALQQFRGIGRFAFVAFYLINVLLIVLFTRINFKSAIFKNVVVVGFALLLFSEGYARMKNLSGAIHNERGELFDVSGNGRPVVNTGIYQSLDFGKYQAMLPLPLFHIGSENLWLDCDGALKSRVYDISLKTGLPTFAASMSRTSLHQAFSIAALDKEIMEVPSIICTVDPQRPVLVVARMNDLKPYEQQIIHQATHLIDDGEFGYYELSLSAYSKILEENTRSHVLPGSLISEDPFEFTFGPSWTHWKNWDFRNDLAEDSILNTPDSIVISFWVKNFERDLVPRTVCQFVQKRGEAVTGYSSEYIGKMMVGMKNGDALIERHVAMDSSTEYIEIDFENKLIQGQSLSVNSLIIMDEHTYRFILRNGLNDMTNRIN